MRWASGSDDLGDELGEKEDLMERLRELSDAIEAGPDDASASDEEMRCTPRAAN